MDFSQKPWWHIKNEYDNHEPLGPLGQAPVWGPHGIALVPLYTNGSTGTGWGRETFMAKYTKNHFATNRVLYGYDRDRHAMAWVMRSGRVVCIDIDGKNGGFEHAVELGYLPPTLAETSKSGNGYHLFYEVDDDWDADDGYAKYSDQIGLVTGVDFRATGCVYHYPSQRWNSLPLAKLPDHLSERLLTKARQKAQARSNITKTLELDKEEIAMLHFELQEELAKNIPAGKRNITLFAIGSKMKAAEIDDWDNQIRVRGEEVGLDDDEIEKIVSNIDTYGA